MISQEEQKQAVIEASKKLKSILDDVLATGDWDSSLFLKTSATTLKDLRDKTEKLYSSGVVESKTTDADKDRSTKDLPSGFTQVFILLYQVDGADLQGWYRTIKTLVDYGMTRPAYKDEDYAKEFIRSKISNVDRNGYVVVSVKDDAFYQVDKQVDMFGHQLFALRENAVKLENIIEFVHANRKRYAVRNNELVLLGEV